MDFQPAYLLSGLEVRQKDKAPVIRGLFPYNALAVMADRGKVRKETIEPGAFSWSINAPEREINLLVGHDFGKPVASKQNGTLEFNDTEEFLEFFATIPPGAERATHITDLLVMLSQGLIKGISPGFRVPPKDVVPKAETLRPEPGNPGVFIRVLADLLLYEISLVTRPAYEAASAELRNMRRLEDRPAPRQRVILP